jgi:hypothetical protein
VRKGNRGQQRRTQKHQQRALERLQRAIDAGAVPIDGPVLLEAEHSPWCRKAFGEAACDCSPQLYVSRLDGATQYRLRRDGTLAPVIGRPGALSGARVIV